MASRSPDLRSSSGRFLNGHTALIMNSLLLLVISVRGKFRGICSERSGEQACLNIVETARRIDEGSTEVYKDFWHGKVFESGEEFLRSQGRSMQSEDGNGKSRENGYDVVSPRISKILGLIRFIREKGQSASLADLHFLGSLKEKAVQLGHAC